VVITEDGSAARLVAKYRPPCPVVVVSDNARALRSLAVTFGLYPMLVGAPGGGRPCAADGCQQPPAACCGLPAAAAQGHAAVILPACAPDLPLSPTQVESFAKGPSRLVTDAMNYALSLGLAVDGIKVLTVTGGPDVAPADESPMLTSEHLGERGRQGLGRSVRLLPEPTCCCQAHPRPTLSSLCAHPTLHPPQACAP
jgi:hypothetical protein